MKEKRGNRRRRIVILDTSLEGDNKMKSVPVSESKQPGGRLDNDEDDDNDDRESSSEVQHLKPNKPLLGCNLQFLILLN